MPRYIDADVLCKVLGKRADDEWNKRASAGTWSDAYRNMIDMLDHEPTADVQPVRHGRWIVEKGSGEYAVCSECKGKSGTQWDGVEPIPLMTQYCPHCGAKMDGGEQK